MATFSVTEVESFKRCRRQWHYGSFNGMALTPIIQPKPYLDLGTMVHKTLAHWTAMPELGTVPGTNQPMTLRHVFIIIATAHRKEAIERYHSATGQEPSEEELQPLLDAITLGASMMENYQNYYKEPLPKHLKFCMPEQEIIIPIPGTEHACNTCIASFERSALYVYSFAALQQDEKIEWLRGKYPDCETCQGSAVEWHYLKMRLDGLAMDKRSNLYIVERKTFEQHPNLHLLEVSDQFIGYTWGTQKLAEQMPVVPETGSTPRVIGLAYDGLWKRSGVPTSGKYKGQFGSLFVRHIITPSQDEVDEYGEQLAETVMDMANSPRIYKNRVWQGCWDCSFERLCRTQSQGGDMEYMLRTEFMSRREDDASDIAKTVELAVL